ncbi:MAG TPA: permease [Candidatus Pacearchaeota archaeon]|nr:permease [Candidatus Pacearchaeota archaeon]HPR79919.1 permease [Candidatus Pacearchaeota archaeon]
MDIFYPVKIFTDLLTSKLDSSTQLYSATNFFIYDSIKILILLAVIIFIVSFIRTYFTPEKVRLYLAKKNKYLGNILASLLGIITPFCSCSAVPLFLGFSEAGVPLGATFSFLVASPMINEVALIMLWGMFGFKIAAIYIISGLLIAIFSGIVIERLKVESLIVNSKEQNRCGCEKTEIKEKSFKERLNYANNYTLALIKNIWMYVLLGIGIGAWIHGYVPTDFLAKYAGSDNWFAVPLATLIGIPLYSNAAGIIPLIGALTEKGVAMGTALSFMMAVTALSLPEFIILKKIMKTKLVIIYAIIVGLGIVFTGYLFNLIFLSQI